MARLIKWVVQCLILKRNVSEKIVLSGDFNDIANQKLDFLLGLGLNRVIEKGTATHIQGGHLDQVWTNLEITDSEVIHQELAPSDHYLIRAKLIIKGQE